MDGRDQGNTAPAGERKAKRVRAVEDLDSSPREARAQEQVGPKGRVPARDVSLHSDMRECGAGAEGLKTL